MSCCNSDQILCPGPNDAVSIGQVLGTRGDINFDERGSVALEEGQETVEVEFLYEKCSAAYVFEYHYVAGTDGTPDDIRAVPNVRTVNGFTMQLSGEPVTANSTLYWRVVVPDDLQTSQPPAAPAQYAIVRPEQHGSQALVADQTTVIVTFAETHPDNDWGFEQLWIQKAPTEAEPETFAWTCIAHSTTGFSLKLSGAPSDSDYSLHWMIR